jgi:hypothetical protein
MQQSNKEEYFSSLSRFPPTNSVAYILHFVSDAEVHLFICFCLERGAEVEVFAL